MSRATPVHKIAAAYWFVQSAAVIAWAWFGSDPPWIFAAILLSFAVPEGWAIRNKTMAEHDGIMVPLRDTLSEVLTWFARFSKPGAKWYMWTNGAVVFIALHWGWIVGRMPDSVVLGVASGAITTVALTYHWLRPDKVG